MQHFIDWHYDKIIVASLQWFPASLVHVMSVYNS